MSEKLMILDHEPCRYLLSKGMYVNAGMPEGQSLAGDGHVWCMRTQEFLGPDREVVGRCECRPGRNCYETIA